MIEVSSFCGCWGFWGGFGFGFWGWVFFLGFFLVVVAVGSVTALAGEWDCAIV